MDCMDCHNRPSHSYKPPSNFVDDGITAGEIPSDLPEIKSLSMEIMDESYQTKTEAHEAIHNKVMEFYEENYEELYKNDLEKIEMAIAGLTKRFSINIFPAMQVSWKVYPNNIGHQTFNGCFRCHNNEMESESTTGTEVSLVGSFQLPFNLTYSTNADFLFPFSKDDDYSMEWENVINLKLFKYISLDYKLKLENKIQEEDEYIVEKHSLFLRVTYFLR